MQAHAIAFFTLLVIDLTWITMQKDMYGAMVSNVQGTAMHVSVSAAVAAYAFVLLTFFGVVVPLVKGAQSTAEAFIGGATVGLAVYGVYNATNMSIFKSYSPWVALVDTCWGTLLFGTVAAVFMHASSRGSS